MPKFELKGKVSLDGSKWKAGLQQADREADKFTKKIATRIGGAIKASLIAGIVAGVTIGIRDALASLKKAARIRDLSKAIGVTPERFQQMEFAADQSGSSGEQMVASIKGLSKTQQRANERDTDGKFKDRGIRETFAKFGITDEELDLQTAALFQVLGEKIGQGFNEKDALADIQKLMEESGVGMIPVFAAGLEKTMKQARDSGGVVSASNVSLAAAGDDAATTEEFKSLGKSMRAAAENQKNIIDAITVGGSLKRGASSAVGGAASIVKEMNEQKGLLNEMLDYSRQQAANTKETAKNTAPLNQ
jgi:hypothetical protein